MSKERNREFTDLVNRVQSCILGNKYLKTPVTGTNAFYCGVHRNSWEKEVINNQCNYYERGFCKQTNYKQN